MDIGFIIKKFITFFVEPWGMVLTMLVLGLYFLYKNRYKLAKIFISLGLGLLLLLAYPPFSNFLIQSLEDKYSKYDYQQDIKYIHVLGSGHNTDNTQPLSSQVGAIKRIIEGVIIYKQIKDSKLILTGFKGETDISNAQMNEKLALALGVKKEDIIIGTEPKDTHEEAIFTKSILGKEAFVLVTSATHLPRSMKLFKSLGLNPIPAPTEFKKGEFRGFLRIPTLGSFYKSSSAIHEYYGMLWNYIKESLHGI